ncbi:uncharacterized protein LOC114340575 [Diabrotica virgifera virgifera]|uniref:NADP-dependent oxidoreductase domain-containing protein n=1 Tax=Diabrotica virgifera virgifera TaxID=50390 RepID=A0ABM5JM00_DIAVI|nr:uncharacterized protein LOC114340575 [Diabrotica virgifera virgifera]
MSLKMYNGVKIPIIGLGTWQSINEDELEATLDTALTIGYRHIDTAAVYHNEKCIGKVLRKWFDSGKLKREDIFITTKLGPEQTHPDLVESALNDSLEKLHLEYVDLYLVHFPIHMKLIDPLKPWHMLDTDYLEVWKKMEEQVDCKRARTIGISNFSIEQMERIMKNSRIKPANTQVELQVYFQQKELREYCRKNNIVVVSYSSLGSPGAPDFFKKIGRTVPVPNILGDPVVSAIAKKHKRTPSQIILSYLTQNDIVVIPKTVKPERLQENFDILDIILDSDDLTALENLDKGTSGRIFDMTHINPKIKEHAHYPFEK